MGLPDLIGGALDLLDPPTNPYLHDPAGWIADRLGEHLWSKQRQVAESVRDHRYTAVQSCHDAGKSFIASRLAAWWLDVHPPGEAFVVTTAPTFPQVRAILWREIGKAHRKADLPGRVNQTEWHIGGEIVAYGRKPADYDQAAFQGIHARYVLVIVDEACGVPKSLFDAVDALVTNEDCRVLAIGNPDDPAAHFQTVCQPSSGWNVIHIDGLQTPNFTGEPVPDSLRPLLLSRTWVEERKQRWGEGSALYTAKVRGLFPEDAEESVIPLSWVRAAQRRHLDGSPAEGDPDRVGVDVARGGGDLSAIAVRHGRRIEQVVTLNRDDTTVLVGDVIRHARGAEAVVDVIGVGSGPYDQLRSQGHRAVPFNASQATGKKDRAGELGFVNCVTGDTRVTPIGRPLRIYRARHDGPLYRVKMASGDEFTVTPNHQVLTPRGWVAAQTLDVGDQLLDTLAGQRNQVGQPQVGDVPPTISEVYRAVTEPGSSERVHVGRAERVDGAVVNFHGDRPTGEVEVVTIDRDLLPVDPAGREHGLDPDLIRPLGGQGSGSCDRGLAETVGLHRSERRGLDGLVPRRAAADSATLLGATTGSKEPVGLHVGTRRDALVTEDAQDGPLGDPELPRQRGSRRAGDVAGRDLFGVDVERVGDLHGFGLAPWCDAVFGKDAPQGVPVSPEVLAERVQRLAGPVPADEVVSVDVVPPARHERPFVYTLETSTGAYRTNSVAHRNCRSAAWWGLRELLEDGDIDLPDDDDLAAELAAPRWQVTASGKVKVESKDEIRKRLGRSTDKADAVIQAFWTPEPNLAESHEVVSLGRATGHRAGRTHARRRPDPRDRRR